MKILLCMLVILPSAIFSQIEDTGIKFEEGLTWQQVVEKAKNQNKYIFVDCYTTWCFPCKKMDKEVYVLEEVGKVYNDRFISFKLQMDSTSQDSESVQRCYTTAAEFKKQYNISSYPTYLFFSPEGNAIDKRTG